MRWITACCFLFSLLPALHAKDGDIPSPQETVQKLYTDHLAGKGLLIDEAMQSQWDFCFSPELIKSLKAAGRGFDPLFFAQDEEIKDLTVSGIEKDERGNSLVLVTFKNFGKPVRLVVSLHHTDHGHRIDNIVEPATGIDLIHDLADDRE